jgi:hypothetical protein
MTDLLETAPPEDELVVGARAIAKRVFDGKLNPRQVYNLLENDPTWPAFKLARKWACRPADMRAEISRRVTAREV